MKFVVIEYMGTRIIFLMGMCCLALMSVAQTQADSIRAKKKPVVFLNGKPIRDTLHLTNFEKIDYLKGQQAVDFAGPRGQAGVFLVNSDGKIPVYGTLSTAKGKMIRNVQIFSSEGKLLATTNTCGTFFIAAYPLYDELTIRRKGYDDVLLRVQQTENSVTLTKKRE